MTVPVGRNDTQQAREAERDEIMVLAGALALSERAEARKRIKALQEQADAARAVAARYERYDVWQGLAAENARLEAERDTLAKALREANGAATKADDPGHIYVRFPCAAWDILRAAAGGADTPTALRDALWEIAHFVVDPDDDPAYCFAEVRKIARDALAAGRAGTP